LGADGAPADQASDATAVSVTIAINGCLVVIAILKGRLWLGILGVLIPLFALVGAVRLGKPDSPWARWRYSAGSRKARRAAERARRHELRWVRRKHGPGRLTSGIDELVDQFLAQKKVRRRQRIVLELPSNDGSAELAETMGAAIHRYCALEIDRTRQEGAVIWRQGTSSLLSGCVLFVVGVVLSYFFTRPDAPEFWQELLGNGVFLVVAWVGLWYPLDLLFMARKPLKRKMQALTDMQALQVLVRTRTPDISVAPPA